MYSAALDRERMLIIDSKGSAAQNTSRKLLLLGLRIWLERLQLPGFKRTQVLKIRYDNTFDYYNHE